MPDPIRVVVVGTRDEKRWWELQAEAAVEAGVVLSEISVAGGGLPERWFALLDSPDVDAVCVSGESDSQTGLILAALHAGKHVLAVPPVANDLESAQQIARIAEDRDLVLKTALPDRHRPAVAQLRRWVATGTTGGDPFVLVCRVGRPVIPAPDAFANDSLDWLLARALGVTSWLDRRLADVISLDSPKRDSAVVTLGGRDQTTALVQVTSACEPMAFAVEVTGRDACATAYSGGNGVERASLVERDLAGPFHEVVVQSARFDTYAAHEWEEFAASIRTKRCRNEVEHTLALARLFLAARRSARTGGVEAA